MKNIETTLETGLTLREFAKKYSNMTIFAMTPSGYVVITPDMIPELDTMMTIRVNADSETFLMDDADFVLSNVVTRAGVKENDWTRVYVFAVEPDGESLSSAEDA